jgi:hypothetical protein
MLTLPTHPRSLRLSDQDITRLGQLQKQLGRSQTEVVSMALTHLLATLRRDERVHLTLPEVESGIDVNEGAVLPHPPN